MFVSPEKDTETHFDTGWELVAFLIFVVTVEHFLLILKTFIEQSIDDTP